MQNKNSQLAWKRNGFYGRVSGIKSMLNLLLDTPLTSQERARLSISINFLENIILDRNKNIEEFGKINGFKKYQDNK